MRVFALDRNDPDVPLTSPIRETNGLTKRLLAGDVYDPMFGDWFGPKFPAFALSARVRSVPFYSWQVPLPFGWVWRGYVGFKVYGADSEKYRHFMPEECVYEGSQAMCLSFRPFQFRRLR